MDNTRRPFIEHLEELRRRILLSAGAVLIFSAAAFFFHGTLLELLRRPIDAGLVFISPQEAFVVTFKVSVLVGALVASPFITWQVWKFVGEALNRKEKRFILTYAPAAFLLFAAGASFGFFIVLPEGLRFLLGFGSAVLEPMITVDRYVSFIFLIVAVFGITFQIPLVMRAVSSAGLVDKKTLASGRAYAIILIFTFSALLTPPDVFTQVALAVPVIILYEAGILVARKSPET